MFGSWVVHSDRRDHHPTPRPAKEKRRQRTDWSVMGLFMKSHEDVKVGVFTTCHSSRILISMPMAISGAISRLSANFAR